jgi:small subunit ribosomal protein S1
MTDESNELESGGGMVDDALDREIQDALGGKSLEDLLDETAPAPQRAAADGGPIEPGQIRPAIVVSIDRDMVMVHMGGKDQGMVPLNQFTEPPAVGAQLTLSVARYDRAEDLWVLSLQGAIEHASWDSLQQGQIVEAMVEGLNKGGLEVKFNGIKAFMPLSQISLYRVEDASEFIRQKLKCQVVEVNKHEQRVIVSARAVLELEAQEKREKLLTELAEGQTREGTVRQVMNFGAFVDLGGVDGLVHVSQISHDRVDDPSKVLQVGQKVQVMVLKIDHEAHRISLGMKQLLQDPWNNVETKYPVGLTVSGTITRIADFGSFCRVEAGLEGLIPISEMSWTQRVKHPSDMLQVGQAVQAQVLAVDPVRKRLSLSIKATQANPWSGVGEHFPASSIVQGKVMRTTDFGAFVELTPGVEGLVHISELSNDRVRRVEDAVQVGQTITVKVLEVSEQARRISLSVKQAMQQEAPPPGEEAPEFKPKKRKKPLRGGLE